MQTIIPHPEPRQAPLRAIVEVVNGEVAVYPIANSDNDERQILDALRFISEKCKR